VGALLAALALMLGITTAATASYAATSNGWVSVGNLSQTPSAVDVYLYPTGSTSAAVVDHDVAYGTVLPAQTVSAGGYTVKMLTAGSAVTSAPVWSASFTVQAGHEYTVVPLRTSATAGSLKVLDDMLTAPTGNSLVRVIQADPSQKTLTFHCSCGPGAKGNILTNGAPGTVTPYATIPPGAWVMTATGPSAKGSAPVPLTANTVRTEVVIGGASGLTIVNLRAARGRRARQRWREHRFRRHGTARPGLAAAVADGRRRRPAAHPGRRRPLAPPRPAAPPGRPGVKPLDCPGVKGCSSPGRPRSPSRPACWQSLSAPSAC
jgi:hypothetical protein